MSETTYIQALENVSMAYPEHTQAQIQIISKLQTKLLAAIDSGSPSEVTKDLSQALYTAIQGLKTL